MNEYLLATLIFVGICAVAAMVTGVVNAVENIRIAKHTGADPRPAKIRQDRP